MMAAFAFVSLDRQSCTVSRVRDCCLLNCTQYVRTAYCFQSSTTRSSTLVRLQSFFKHELPIFAHFGGRENRFRKVTYAHSQLAQHIILLSPLCDTTLSLPSALSLCICSVCTRSIQYHEHGFSLSHRHVHLTRAPPSR